VEGDCALADELGLVVEQSRQHPVKQKIPLVHTYTKLTSHVKSSNDHFFLCELNNIC
jgi:hypothetical protein